MSVTLTRDGGTENVERGVRTVSKESSTSEVDPVETTELMESGMNPTSNPVPPTFRSGRRGDGSHISDEPRPSVVNRAPGSVRRALGKPYRRPGAAVGGRRGRCLLVILPSGPAGPMRLRRRQVVDAAPGKALSRCCPMRPDSFWNKDLDNAKSHPTGASFLTYHSQFTDTIVAGRPPKKGVRRRRTWCAAVPEMHPTGLWSWCSPTRSQPARTGWSLRLQPAR